MKSGSKSEGPTVFFCEKQCERIGDVLRVHIEQTVAELELTSARAVLMPGISDRKPSTSDEKQEWDQNL